MINKWNSDSNSDSVSDSDSDSLENTALFLHAASSSYLLKMSGSIFFLYSSFGNDSLTVSVSDYITMASSDDDDDDDDD